MGHIHIEVLSAIHLNRVEWYQQRKVKRFFDSNVAWILSLTNLNIAVDERDGVVCDHAHGGWGPRHWNTLEGVHMTELVKGESTGEGGLPLTQEFLHWVHVRNQELVWTVSDQL